jgi:hypothetical protein
MGGTSIDVTPAHFILVSDDTKTGLEDTFANDLTLSNSPVTLEAVTETETTVGTRLTATDTGDATGIPALQTPEPNSLPLLAGALGLFLLTRRASRRDRRRD